MTENDQLPDNLPLCLWARPSSPPVVYFLADHLDAVLAAGEDLSGLGLTWISTASTSQEATVRDRDALRGDFEAIQSLELQLIARLLKSRDRAEDLMRADPRLKLMARLFLAGTSPVLDAVAELSDATNVDFETGDATLAYLRTRGLIAADAAAPEEGATLKIDNDFFVARRLKLGDVLDLAAQFLDTMELHHDIFADVQARMAPAEVEEVLPDQTALSAPAERTGPSRPAYRSLTAALEALEQQERAERQDGRAQTRGAVAS